MQRLVISSEQFLDDSTINLLPEQRHYLFSVIRLKIGDRLIILDGCGKGWIAQLETEDRAKLLETYLFKTECPIPVKLVAALPKNGFDEVVRCCTELGVTHIYPIISERTILKPSDNKLQRWRKIATEAAEQSERAIVPEIFEPQPFKSALNLFPHEHIYLCAARDKSLYLLDAFPQTLPPEIVVMIGTEGGWTDSEIQQAIAQNIKIVSLGASILRAVTASIAAIALTNGHLTQLMSDI